MPTINLTLGGLSQYLGRLAEAPAKVDLTPTLRIFSVMLSAATKENFVKQSSPDGKPWAPLKRPRRNSRGRDLILRDTGLLMASWAAQGGSHVERVEKSASGWLLVWGSSLDRALWHQRGTRHMVARPMAGITPELTDKFTRVLGEQLSKQLSAVK